MGNNQSSTLANVDEDQVDGLPANHSSSNLGRFHSSDGSSSRTTRWNRTVTNPTTQRPSSRFSSSSAATQSQSRSGSPSTPIANKYRDFSSSPTPSPSDKNSRPPIRNRSRSINALFPKQTNARPQEYPQTAMEEGPQPITASGRRISSGGPQKTARSRKKSIDLVDYLPEGPVES